MSGDSPFRDKMLLSGGGNASCSSVYPFTSDHHASKPGKIKTVSASSSSTTSVCSRSSRTNYNLSKNQILVKLSHVNDAFIELKTELYDGEEKEELHFVRIVRIGPQTQHEATLPGALIVVQRRRGIYLEDLSKEHGESYYLLLESDIKSYIEI